jgi:hypothetical protein
MSDTLQLVVIALYTSQRVSSSLELNVGSDDDKLKHIGHSLSPGKVVLAFVVLRVRNVDNKLIKRIGHSVERWTHDDRESYNPLSLAIELEETATP